MALTQISTGGIKDDAVTDAKLPANSVGNSEMKDDAVGVAELSATGTASGSTFLRGDNSWATPADTNTQVGGSTGADFDDNVKARFGTGNDLEIFHDGSHNYIQSAVDDRDIYINSSRDLYLKTGDGATGTHTVLYAADNGGVHLKFDNVTKLETITNGVQFPGDAQFQTAGTVDAMKWDNEESNLEFRDNISAVWGDGKDLEIKHDASNTYITNSTGQFAIQGDDLKLRSKTDLENYVVCTHNGSVELYYDSSKKLETTTTGVKVTNATTPLVEVQNSTDTSYSGVKLEQSSGSGGSFSINKLGTNSSATGGANAAQLWQSANAPIVFGTNNTEASRITSNGSQYWFCTSEPSASVSGCSIMNNEGEIRMGNSGTGTTTRLRFSNANGEVGSISTNGSATTYATSSDYRLKENQVVISDGITRLKTLKPYRFNFKKDPTTTVDGFFAHEVTAVPEAISGEKDSIKEDGSIDPQGIDQSKLVPLLTAALQEAITKIETLETKVAALEAK